MALVFLAVLVALLFACGGGVGYGYRAGIPAFGWAGSLIGLLVLIVLVWLILSTFQ